MTTVPLGGSHRKVQITYVKAEPEINYNGKQLKKYFLENEMKTKTVNGNCSKIQKKFKINVKIL